MTLYLNQKEGRSKLKILLILSEFTVACRKTGLFGREERRFLYFNHLSKEFLEQMIPHLKALI